MNKLQINNSLIEKLEIVCFEKLTNLDLSHNKLNNLYTNHCQNIQCMDLSHDADLSHNACLKSNQQGNQSMVTISLSSNDLSNLGLTWDPQNMTSLNELWIKKTGIILSPEQPVIKEIKNLKKLKKLDIDEDQHKSMSEEDKELLKLKINI